MKLQKGEIICPKCKGEGGILITEIVKDEYPATGDLCPKCNGEGKIDWIENLIGKKCYSDITIKSDFSTSYDDSALLVYITDTLSE